VTFLNFCFFSTCLIVTYLFYCWQCQLGDFLVKKVGPNSSNTEGGAHTSLFRFVSHIVTFCHMFITQRKNFRLLKPSPRTASSSIDHMFNVWCISDGTNKTLGRNAVEGLANSRVPPITDINSNCSKSHKNPL
jgi:hypothetical protein